MTTHVWVLSVALAVTALLAWGSMVRDEYETERVTRPTFVVFAAGLAWALYTDGRPPTVAVALPLFVALGLSLVADLFLLTATTGRYRLGLVAAVLASGVWAWAVLERGGSDGLPWAVLPAALGLFVLQGRVGRHVVRHAGRDRGLVLLSLAVLAGLVLVAAFAANWVVLGAAVLLLVAQLLGGHDRFVLERHLAPVQAVAAQHAALVLMVLGLLR